MSELKTALDMGDDVKVAALTNDVKEIARIARGSKARIRCATRVLAVNQSSEGDERIDKWTQQNVATSVMQGLFDVVREHEEVDRFCGILGQRLMEGSLNRVQGNMRGMDWYWCVKTLLLMRDPEALNLVLDYAEQSPHGSPGTLNLLARGGELKHEAERVRRYVNRWEGTGKLGHATRDWILAKLGDKDAYEALVQLCLNKFATHSPTSIQVEVKERDYLSYPWLSMYSFRTSRDAPPADTALKPRFQKTGFQ